MGLGIGEYGVSAWGIGAPIVPLSIVDAYAPTTNTVRVTLSTTPRARSTIAAGDALNPDTWVVLREDTLFAFQILEVEQQSDTVFDLRLLQPLAPAAVTHKVVTATLRAAAGGLVVPPTFQEFLGLLAANQSNPGQQAAARKLAFRDLANPPAAAALAGTLVIGSDGDYASVTGADLVRKLVLRRLTTGRGAFFHLPDYGVGLLVVKEPLPGQDLLKLKVELERQVLLEPEVESAQASLLMKSDGTLFIKLSIRLKKTGQVVPISVTVSANGIQF